jgi:hypothetical protein
LEKNIGYVKILFRMKSFWILALLALATYGFTGCASTDKTASGDPVPGEQKNEEQRLAPGAGAPGSASVKW